MQIEQRLLRGSLFRVVTLALNILSLLLILPLMVKTLGSEVYGLWALIISMTSYYALLDFGILYTISRYIARARGQVRQDRLAAYFSNALFATFLIGIGSLLLTWLLTHYLHLFYDGDLLEAARVLLLIVGVELSLSLPLKVYQGVMKGYLMFNLLALYESVRILLRTYLFWLLLSHQYGVFAVAVSNGLVNLFWIALSAHLVIRSLPDVRFQWRAINPRDMRKLFHYSGYIFVSNLAEVGRFRILPLIIGLMQGLTAVTLFAIAMRIMDAFTNLIWRIVGVFEPYFAELEGGGRHQAIEKLFIHVMRFSYLLCAFVTGNILLIGDYFVATWMGPEYGESATVMQILGVAFFFYLANLPTTYLLRALGQHRYFTYIDALEGAVIVLLSLVLIKPFGLIGATLGLAIPMALTSLLVRPLIALHFTGISAARYFRTIAADLTLQGGYFLLLYYLIHRVFGWQQLSYPAMAAICVLDVCLLALIVLVTLRPEERRRVLGYLRLSA